MKTAPILLALLLCTLSVAHCRDVIVGTSYYARLVWQQTAKYNAIPFIKRVKEVFYNDPGNQIIKGIIMRDLNHSKAVASVTAGGVGYSYANIKLKSTRGSGLNYQIEIYV